MLLKKKKRRVGRPKSNPNTAPVSRYIFDEDADVLLNEGSRGFSPLELSEVLEMSEREILDLSDMVDGEEY